MANEDMPELSDSDLMKAVRAAQPSHHDIYGIRGVQDSHPQITGPNVSGSGNQFLVSAPE